MASQRITKRQKELVVKLRKDGFSYSQIARKAKMSKGSAHLIIKRLGYDPYIRPAWSGSFKEFMKRHRL
jgi:DNA invertase Pin-like site-specific DNA recombinase